MSRTDLDPKTLAKSLRRMCGDGSMEWVTEPIQASVLLDIADMLDENAKLREERREYQVTIDDLVDECCGYEAENAKLREVVEHDA